MISPLEDVRGLTELAEGPADFETTEEIGFYKLALRRLMRHRMAILGGVCLLIVAVAALVGPLLLPASWDQADLEHRFTSPAWPHIMGTDELGRDIFRRILDGGRVSLAVGLLATVVVITLGVTMGTLAGYFGGLIDNLMMRFTDAILAIPSIFLLILLTSGFGHTAVVIILAIGFTLWTDTARVVRSVVLSVREKEFVEAARAVGSGTPTIIVKHVLTNVLGPIMVASTLTVGIAIITESALSYLGQGIGPPIASWGSMLFHAQEFIWDAPFYALFPGTAILITVLSINFLGDGLRDAFDPRSFER
ncbi:MAG TPA: ABC transporter permease [Candidatus Dormibacteraeota bacterium]|nr:ABC transporter permease [Candidatus Dormibacteraeota bacterium]